jgi:hypothetical protein
MGGGMGASPDQGPPAGQTAQILQQVQQLLAQVMQNEPDPQVQDAVNTMLKMSDALMQAVGAHDTQDMSSGLNNPGAPEGSPAEEAGESPATEAAEDQGTGGKSPPKTFKGARSSAMSKMGKSMQTPKTKNRMAKAGMKAQPK